MRLSDQGLVALEKRYTPTVIKPCRVCGGDMGVGSIGGGEPTVWFCNHAFDNGRGLEAWDHYGKSKFMDRRQGGDEEVCALIAEVRALRECKDLVAIVSRNRHRLGECLFVARASDPMVIDPGWPSSSVAVRIPGDMIRAALAGVRALEDKP